jgi:hypothetical protein
VTRCRREANLNCRDPSLEHDDSEWVRAARTPRALSSARLVLAGDHQRSPYSLILRCSEMREMPSTAAVRDTLPPLWASTSAM